MSIRYNKILPFLAGVVVSLALTVSYLPFWGVKPYTGVEVINEEWSEAGLTINAPFVKNDSCTLIDFSVVSFASGIPRYVRYNDLDGLGNNFDREAGEHGLNVFIPIRKAETDFIELRTRHKCITGKGGETEVITKVFSRHEPT